MWKKSGKITKNSQKSADIRIHFLDIFLNFVSNLNTKKFVLIRSTLIQLNIIPQKIRKIKIPLNWNIQTPTSL